MANGIKNTATELKIDSKLTANSTPDDQDLKNYSEDNSNVKKLMPKPVLQTRKKIDRTPINEAPKLTTKSTPEDQELKDNFKNNYNDK